MFLPPPPPRAVPLRLRVPVAVVVAIGLVGLLLSALRYRGTGVPGAIDRAARSGLSGLDGGGPLERVVSLGHPWVVVLSATVLGVVCLLLGHRRLAVVAIAGPGLTGVATTGLKPVIDRTIDGSLALPSGHTGGVTSLAVVAALLLITVAGSWGLPVLVPAALGVAVAGGLMGVALVAGDVHYATDTVAGFCTAVAVVGTVALVVDRIADRVGTRPVDPPPRAVSR